MTEAGLCHCLSSQRAVDQRVSKCHARVLARVRDSWHDNDDEWIQGCDWFYAGDLSNVLGLGSQASGLQDLGHVDRES